MIENLEILRGVTCDWVMAKGPMADIVISSRIRLARNLAGYPFFQTAGKSQLLDIWQTVRQSSETLPHFQNAYEYKIADLSHIEREFLLERHLISRELFSTAPGRGVLISRDQKFSIMINEEDHIRVQIVLSGFRLSSAWFELNRLDDLFSERMPYAFDNNLGYLTACPTNVGTGLRASLLLHLPGLALTKQIKKVFNSFNHLGLTVRGLYGEGSEMKGNLFQISNQVTLGRSEIGLIEDLERTARHILKSERQARRALLDKAHNQIEDKIWRAYGLLCHARIISSDELINLSSGLRLGVTLGIIQDLSINELNDLLLSTQPAHLQSYFGRKINSSERNYLRAEFIRNWFTEKHRN
ncbi:MAG: protein arginine kinase [Candidatus Cloacimonetes bacterium 4572_55]|nr:MAG: protein arginine kinase [Candidatus Cloacimonetes bacterium 4572_55]